MPTNANRPFLSNFLAAFRAQSAFQSAAPSPTSQSPSTTTTASAKPATQSYTTSSTTYDPSSRPTAGAKPNAASSNPTTAAGANTTTTQTSFSPYGKAPSTPGTPPQTSGGGYNYNNGYPIPPSSSSPSRHRRGSDSSSDGGFRERTGSAGANGGNAMPEKWYIGGRTPGGEERFYKLGMVRRMRSSDRLSLDRLSL